MKGLNTGRRLTMYRRKSLDSRSTELAELQARLGAMETRLKHVQAREAPSAPVFMKESSSTTGKTVSVVEQPGARNLVVRSHRPRWAPRIVVTDSDEASEQDDGSYNKDSETKVSTGEGIGKPQAHRSHASRSQPVNSGQEQFHQA